MDTDRCHFYLSKILFLRLELEHYVFRNLDASALSWNHKNLFWKICSEKHKKQNALFQNLVFFSFLCIFLQSLLPFCKFLPEVVFYWLSWLSILYCLVTILIPFPTRQWAHTDWHRDHGHYPFWCICRQTWLVLVSFWLEIRSTETEGWNVLSLMHIVNDLLSKINQPNVSWIYVLKININQPDSIISIKQQHMCL